MNTAGILLCESMRRYQISEPNSLHPVINPNRCLGCGACVQACPEGNVLGLVHGRADLVNPSNCLGHGACASSCPFDAITLALGTERRGVDIPVLTPDFETNVPGLFVAGELAGMGLIRNAVEQGRQAIDAIAKLDGIGSGERFDVVIVGAGPAGLAASLAAMERGLRAVTLEQEGLGGAITQYPRRKLVMTSPVELPLYGRLEFRETTKERLIDFWHEVVAQTGVTIRDREPVQSIERYEHEFEVRTERARYRTRAVLLAIGRRGTPRKLEVPGENTAKVVYRLLEPQQYAGQHVLVVGGGDSALEAAVLLAERQECASVRLCHRGSAISSARRENRQALDQARSSGRLELLIESRVLEIGESSVRLETPAGPREIESDAVIVCAGGVLPTGFLRSIGVDIETRRGTPLHRAAAA